MKLKSLIAEGKKQIVLNMDNIKYIDSSGLGTLAAGAGLRFDLEAEGHSIHVTDKGE